MGEVLRGHMSDAREQLRAPFSVAPLLLLCGIFAVAYSAFASLKGGEDLVGWGFNAIASLIGAAQVLLVPLALVLALTSAAVAHSLVLDRLFYFRRCDLEPWRQMSFGRSHHWTFWAGAVPAAAFGVIVLLGLYVLFLELPLGIPEIGDRVLELYPVLRQLASKFSDLAA